MERKEYEWRGRSTEWRGKEYCIYFFARDRCAYDRNAVNLSHLPVRFPKRLFVNVFLFQIGKSFRKEMV